MGAKESVGKQLGECGSNGCKGNCGLTVGVVWVTGVVKRVWVNNWGIVWFTWV